MHRTLPQTPNARWQRAQETSKASSFRITATRSATANIHHNLKQSHTPELVSFASHTAISRTFNSLFKVLFTFPSQYLFAIGLEPIFSFRRRLPPVLRTNSKVRDSPARHRTHRTFSERRGFHPLCRLLPKKLTPTSVLVTHL